MYLHGTIKEEPPAPPVKEEPKELEEDAATYYAILYYDILVCYSILYY